MTSNPKVWNLYLSWQFKHKRPFISTFTHYMQVISLNFFFQLLISFLFFKRWKWSPGYSKPSRNGFHMKTIQILSVIFQCTFQSVIITRTFWLQPAKPLYKAFFQFFSICFVESANSRCLQKVMDFIDFLTISSGTWSSESFRLSTICGGIV